MSLDELKEIVRANARATDESGQFPVQNLAALRETGYLGMIVPAEYGGMGCDLDEFLDTAQQIASCCLSTAMIWAMHCQQVDAIVRHAGSPLRQALLPRIAAGEVYLASVTTEPQSGASLLAAGAALDSRDRALLIARDAPVVTGGGYADGFLITMRAAPDAPPNKVTLVYADRADLTVTRTGDWKALGMRGTDSIPMRLEGSVPESNIVGGAGEFRAIAFDSMIPLAHLGWSACWLGAARGVFADLIACMTRAAKGGGPDPVSELLRERLARIRANLELISAYLARIADEVTAARLRGSQLDRPATQIHINTLKLISSDLAFDAVDRMMQLAGLSRGYSSQSQMPLERVFRDLRSAALNYSNDRLWLANGALVLLDRGVSLA